MTIGDRKGSMSKAGGLKQPIGELAEALETLLEDAGAAVNLLWHIKGRMGDEETETKIFDLVKAAHAAGDKARDALVYAGFRGKEAPRTKLCASFGVIRSDSPSEQFDVICRSKDRSRLLVVARNIPKTSAERLAYELQNAADTYISC